MSAVTRVIPEAELIRYESMCTAIAECHRVDEVKEIHDKARAVEVYLKQARNTEAERKATDIRIRAERRTGELLKELARASHDRGNQHVAKSNDAIQPKSEYAEALEKNNISRQTANRYEALANVPKETFESYLNDPKERPTTSKIINEARDPVPKLNTDSLRVWGIAREWEREREGEFDFISLYVGMTETMRADMDRLVPKIAEYWVEFARQLATKDDAAIGARR